MNIGTPRKSLAPFVLVSILTLCLALAPSFAEVPPIRGLHQVEHADVELHGGFWGTRQDIHHEVTVPHALDCLEKAGHVTNFDKAAGKFEGPLRGGRPFYQWGAGEVGKRWLREWQERKPEAVVDINPRKIGRRIHDAPVIAPEDLPPPGETFVVVAVGAPGARTDIRDWLTPRGYEETRDFLFLA